MKNGLKSKHTPGGSVNQIENGWRMEIPAKSASQEYCLAQIDDYASLPRRRLHHSPPWFLSLQARVSEPNIPGTWGFGLWNDPFGFSLGFDGTPRRLPALPNTAWFFYASPPNWLSVHDSIPAQGFFAGTIKSPRTPSLFLAPALLALPLLSIKPVSRLLRRMTGRIVWQDASLVSAKVTDWHRYSIQWIRETTEYRVDDELILKTRFSPSPPLGLVIWIDNQFAAWDPQGRLGYGTLKNPSAWLEITDINMM